MIFDYSGGSDVNLTWNEEDHEIVKNFLRSNFEQIDITGNSCTLKYAKFILNFDNFHILDSKLIHKSVFSDSLLSLVQNVSDYDKDISNQSIPSAEDVEKVLENKGFKRKLFWYQLRNVQNMVSLLQQISLFLSRETTDALAAYLYSRKTDHDKARPLQVLF